MMKMKSKILCFTTICAAESGQSIRPAPQRRIVRRQQCTNHAGRKQSRWQRDPCEPRSQQPCKPQHGAHGNNKRISRCWRCSHHTYFVNHQGNRQTQTAKRKPTVALPSHEKRGGQRTRRPHCEIDAAPLKMMAKR